MMSGRSILRLSFDLPPDADAELPERLRRLLEDFTPRVQLLEDGALLDLTGATRWWQRDARGITELVQLRVLAYFAVRSSAAVAGSPMLAAMKRGRVPRPRGAGRSVRAAHLGWREARTVRNRRRYQQPAPGPRRRC
jgi:DNA polymerase-4